MSGWVACVILGSVALAVAAERAMDPSFRRRIRARMRARRVRRAIAARPPRMATQKEVMREHWERVLRQQLISFQWNVENRCIGLNGQLEQDIEHTREKLAALDVPGGTS